MSEGSNTDTGDTQTSNKPEITATATSQEVIDKSPPREALITTAMNFLRNPKIRNSSLIQKQQFLLSKGLSNKEIQIACQRLGIFYPDSNSNTIINMDINAPPPLPPAPVLRFNPRQNRQVREVGAFTRIKEILHSVALISGLAYAIYFLYKKFIEPFLFGKKKEKTVTESLQDIDNKVDTKMTEVNRELSNIKETLSLNSQQQNQMINIEFSNFKSDLDAIKGLLLNRKQFANPLTTVSPSIPAWQLSSAPHRRNSHSDNEKNDDAGSGSGSSETEVVTKNSDSSLEIM